MEYAQLNADGSYSHQITTHGNVEWDATHYCPASALTPDEAAQFRVVPLEVVPEPTYDPITQRCYRDGAELVGGAWRYKWTVAQLDAATIAANQAKAIEQLQSAIVTATQSRLDNFAKTRGYDGILSAATYATSTVPKFAQEGQDAVNLRDATWAALYAILAEVTAGTRAMPTGFADVEPSLPVLAWSV